MKLSLYSDDVVLLITGCVSPSPNQAFHALKDVKVRFQQYVDSITWFLYHSSFKNIVFCENSNYFVFEDNALREKEKLCELAAKQHKRLEVISFQGDFAMVEKTNKGYGEGEIIQYALKQSELLRRAKSFCKVTGRVEVLNIDDVFSKIEYGQNYFNRDLAHGRRSIDTRIFCCDIEYYKRNLMLLYKQLEPQNSIEGLFWLTLRDLDKWNSTYAYPDFHGICGATDQPYDINKYLVKVMSIACRLHIYNSIALPLYTALRKIELKLSSWGGNKN